MMLPTIRAAFSISVNSVQKLPQTDQNVSLSMAILNTTKLTMKINSDSVMSGMAVPIQAWMAKESWVCHTHFGALSRLYTLTLVNTT